MSERECRSLCVYVHDLPGVCVCVCVLGVSERVSLCACVSVCLCVYVSICV